jgi:hypothetical protein
MSEVHRKMMREIAQRLFFMEKAELNKKNTAIQICREFWFPLLVACCWTTYEWFDSDQNKTIGTAVKAFGSAFFFVSWLLAQWFRVRKQQKVDGNLQVIEENLNQTILELKSRTKELSDYITGGDSFCFFDFIDDIDENGNIEELVLNHKGAHPIYEITVRVSDCDADVVKFGKNPRFSDLYNSQRTRKLENSSQGIHTKYPIKLELGDSGERNFLFYFYARNGAFKQLMRLKKNGSNYVMAIRVIRNKEVIYEDVPKDFPLEKDGSAGWHRISDNYL